MNLNISNNWINLRHAPNSQRFYDCTTQPVTHQVFDWVIWDPYDLSATRVEKRNPSSILCLAKPPSLDWLLKEIRFDSKPILVVGGEDDLLSNCVNKLEDSSHLFTKIYYEAKDIEHEIIESFCMGFTSFYWRDAGHDNILEAVNYSDTEPKSKILLAAWGQVWRHLDDEIEDRISAIEFLENHTTFKRSLIPQERYWRELAKHCFLLAPRGQGIQAPKLAEAWMVKTIPIVIKNPCFVDLKRQGYPLIIIEHWEDVTERNLAIWLEYRDSLNWQRIRHQLTNEFLATLVSPNRF